MSTSMGNLDGDETIYNFDKINTVTVKLYQS